MTNIQRFFKDFNLNKLNQAYAWGLFVVVACFGISFSNMWIVSNWIIIISIFIPLLVVMGVSYFILKRWLIKKNEKIAEKGIIKNDKKN